MKKLSIKFVVALAVLSSCNSVKKTGNSESKSTEVPCVENTMESCVCLEVYKPVCGCNNKTYPNSCHAKCVGVTYTEGACEE